LSSVISGGKDNLRPRHLPREYLSKYTSRGKPKIPPVDQILMDPGHKASKNPSDNADLGFQAVGPALRIMQLNVEGLSAVLANGHSLKSTSLNHQTLSACRTFNLKVYAAITWHKWSG